MSKVPDAIPSMAGKTCVVTGATSGIGAVTAEALARAGASVLIVGRNRGRCATTVGQIIQATGNPSVTAHVAELSSQAEVRRLAGEIRQQCPRLDVLVNNAGAWFPKRSESADGIEMTWALNHLGYFLLTNLLLDTLKASAPARVVNVASDAHKGPRGIHWADVQSTRDYRAFRAYSQSKLANVLFTRELARRLEGTGVTANVLHPGFVYTGFFDGEGPVVWMIRQLARAVAISPEAGARTPIHLATSAEVEGVSGAYFVREKAVEPSAAARDPEAARRLWLISAEMTSLAESP